MLRPFVALSLVPLQAGLLLSPPVRAHSGSTVFVSPNHRGNVCRALAPQCMTKRQWAKVYLSNKQTNRNYIYPQSCLDAIDLHSHQGAEPPTRFLPDNHSGPTCMAFIPGCMTRRQWAQFCTDKKAKEPNWPFSKSCRDALGIREPYGAAPPTRFLPDNHTGPTCMAFSPSCMTRRQWAQFCTAKKAKEPNWPFPKSCHDALEL